MVVSNRDKYQNVKIRNGTWYADIAEAVTSADMSLALGQVNQLTISADDPGFAFIRKNKIPLKTVVDYEGLRFSVASISMEAGSGNGGFTLTCRPDAVRRLKETKGKMSMSRVSPSQWIKEECRRLGIPTVIQTSAVRSSISRDVPESGSDIEANAWTTFNRLASETGYACYELEGKIYFGRPTWLLKTQPLVKATYNFGNADTDTTQVPSCNESLDNEGKKTISLVLPLERERDLRPGRPIYFNGIPGFTGSYLITSVEFPLAGPGDVTVNAETAIDPDPQGST